MKLIIVPIIYIISLCAQAEQQYRVSIFTDDTAFKCTVSSLYLKSNGQFYTSLPDNLKYLTLTFINRMDDVIIESENGSSIYSYNMFVDLKNDWMHLKKGDLGMNFVLKNGSIKNNLDVFNNGKVVLETGDEADRSAGGVSRLYCPDLRLSVRRHN